MSAPKGRAADWTVKREWGGGRGGSEERATERRGKLGGSKAPRRRKEAERKEAERAAGSLVSGWVADAIWGGVHRTARRRPGRTAALLAAHRRRRGQRHAGPAEPGRAGRPAAGRGRPGPGQPGRPRLRAGRLPHRRHRGVVAAAGRLAVGAAEQPGRRGGHRGDDRGAAVLPGPGGAGSRAGGLAAGPPRVRRLRVVVPPGEHSAGRGQPAGAGRRGPAHRPTAGRAPAVIRGRSAAWCRAAWPRSAGRSPCR